MEEEKVERRRRRYIHEFAETMLETFTSTRTDPPPQKPSIWHKSPHDKDSLKGKILRPSFFFDVTQHKPVVVRSHCVASHKSKDLTYTMVED